MVRKFVFSLVVVALVLMSPAALVAQDGPSLPEAPLVVDGAVDGGGGLQHVTARHGSNADPDGVKSTGFDGVDPLSPLTQWVKAFLSSVLSL